MPFFEIGSEEHLQYLEKQSKKSKEEIERENSKALIDEGAKSIREARLGMERLRRLLGG